MSTTAKKLRLDPRLLVGLALVLASALGVSALVASNNKSEQVYVTTQALAVGHVLESTDVRPASLSLGTVSAGYVRQGDLAPGSVVTRAIGSGEILPSDAVGVASRYATTNVVVQLTSPLPAGAKVGTLVDVWAAPKKAQGQFGTPAVIISGAQIAGITQATGAAGSTGGVRVEIVVPQNKVAALLEAQANGDAVSLVPSVGTAS